MHVLFLHGRGDHAVTGRGPLPPTDQVLATDWPLPLLAPDLPPEWFARSFGDQIQTVDRWLNEAVVAIGHSRGAWLLLCAAHERAARGETFPRMLLLSAVTGIGGGGEGCEHLRFVAPRSRRIRQALGLEPRGDLPALPRALIAFIHAEDDPQCPVEPVRELARLGYEVRIVPGGHRLDHPDAARAVGEGLTRIQEQLR